MFLVYGDCTWIEGLASYATGGRSAWADGQMQTIPEDDFP